MGKVAFMFPGQGAQYTNMGKDFYDRYETAREIYAIANKATGLSLQKICFEENERLHITEYTQIAMLTTEIAMLKCAMKRGLRADVCAGLSLGEYAALAACKAIALEDLFVLIRKRGIYMQQAYPTGGAMTAVLGLDAKIIERVCEETEGIVSIANYNCPGQIVITGELEAVNRASESLKENGAKRCIPLKVSGPFHSSLLDGASKKLGEALQDISISDPVIPYLSNVTADYVFSSANMKELLTRQVASSVLWQQSVEKMIEDGVTTLIEIGPGKTLSGFMRKINKDVKTLNIETVDDLEKVMEELSC